MVCFCCIHLSASATVLTHSVFTLPWFIRARKPTSTQLIAKSSFLDITSVLGSVVSLDQELNYLRSCANLN